MNRDAWREYLRSYSADYLASATEDELQVLDPQQVADGWLGFEPATVDAVAALEARIGLTLPPSYRTFLEVSDGWTAISSSIRQMRATTEVGWFADLDPGFIEIFASSFGDGIEEFSDFTALRRSLLISGEADVAWVYLDPSDRGPDGEWAAWWYASWGDFRRYPSFAALVDSDRDTFEALRARDGRPIRADVRDRKVDQGRQLIWAGDVAAGRDLLTAADRKGSPRAPALLAVLEAFTHGALGGSDAARQSLASFLGDSAGRPDVDLAYVEAALVPLFLRITSGRYAHLARSIADRSRRMGGPEGALVEQMIMMQADGAPPPPWPGTLGADVLQRAAQRVADGNDSEALRGLLDARAGWTARSPLELAPVELLLDPRLDPLFRNGNGLALLRGSSE